MPEELSVVESQPFELTLSSAEEQLVRRLGQEFASSSTWWGAVDDVKVDRSVVRIERLAGDRYRLQFRDVVGIVRLPSVQLRLIPKISWNHFLHIVAQAFDSPRMSHQDVAVGAGKDFSAVLATWYLDSLESLLRRGLRKEYSERTDSLDEIRGTVLAHETLLNLLQGRIAAECVFDDFSEDGPLNRVLRAAAERTARASHLTSELRKRARQVVFRLEEVGSLRQSDLRVETDRMSSSYAPALRLAKLILASAALTTSAGGHVGSAFLVRTPELVENGLREIVARSIAPAAVTKRRLMLDNSGLSMTPDLVINERMAVGDIKYRFLQRDWARGDLNQVIAFATAFSSANALLLGCCTSDSTLPRRLSVGPVQASCLAWLADEYRSPPDSELQLAAELRDWYARVLDRAVVPS